MEVSVMDRQASIVRSELFPIANRLAISGIRTRSKVVLPRLNLFGSSHAAGRRCRMFPAGQAPAVRSQVDGGVAGKVVQSRKQAVVRSPQLFVGLPLDVISDCNSINHTKAIAAGLKALKLLGTDGVEIPVWWGVVEKEAMGKYEWSAYLALVQMIQAAGMQIRISLNFHASKVPAIPLPSWVSSIGDTDPDIYFTDREGKRHRECLSLAADNLPVLGGKTPVQVFEDICQSFQATFSDFLCSTITDISIGLGPGGELRYPSVPAPGKKPFVGVGEFQCYDKHMLNQLKQHAVETGNHYWGLTGPHDAPQYDDTPDFGNFFKEHGGSWETPYGNFFLSWYSEQLVSHGDRLLSRACAVFGSCPVTISAKIPLMHSWYKTRSHASELTAGYFNTDRRDGYDAVAEMFARNSCRMILKGIELSDAHQSQASRSSPESLLSQIMMSCRKHGVRVAGENSSVSGVADGFSKIKEKMMGENPLDSFTYQRMGAYFFSPEHWSLFTEFIRSFNMRELDADDMVSVDTTVSLRTEKVSGSSRQMQAV